MNAVPQGVEIEQIADQPLVVKHAVGEFVHSFIEALVIVLFVSFLALGWRTGIVVAMSVPLVLGIVFVVMNAMSLDLHRITLGALIIALGLLVDDAIIAVEMMVVKMEQGWDRMALLTLGGALKRKEMLSARFGDILSELYLLSAALKRWQDEGRQSADLPALQWCMRTPCGSERRRSRCSGSRPC